MTRPTVTQAESWRPDALTELADQLDASAADLKDQLDAMSGDAKRTHDFWSGAAADAARDHAAAIAGDGDELGRSMVLAAVAARDGAAQIGVARRIVLDTVATARDEGFEVADDGTVTVSREPDAVLVALAGGDPTAAHGMLAVRAQTVTESVGHALDQLGAADDDAARDIEEALTPLAPQRPAATSPAGVWPTTAGDVVAGWPAVGQKRVAEQIASMTPAQRQRLVEEHPQQVGNTDGVPWPMRVAANRTNIAQAILDEDPANPESARRLAFYRSLLGEVNDPTGTGARIDRQILAFDPQHASLIELNGNLKTATSVAVLVPGLNTTIEGSAANTATARRFVAAGRGDVAMITYLGGPFPHGNYVSGVLDAVNPRYAMNMAPRLVSFSEDVDRTVEGTGRRIPVTYVGHSYGGSILGTAEALGMTADRTMYVAAAGAGVGVDDPSDWHNRNPHVLRFSMTAPGDLIQLVQGIPAGTHGADPDEMPGVIPLSAGNYDDGRPMRGPAAHSDVVNWPSDAWRNILGVITGDRSKIQVAS